MESLEAIIEEMERVADMWVQGKQPAIGNWASRLRSIVASLSPEREEFVRIAMRWADWYGRNFPTHSEWSEEEREIVHAYRRMLEAERGKEGSDG